MAAYNKATESHYTIADMKKEYMGYTEGFKDYQEWYTDYGEKASEQFRDSIRDEIGGTSLNCMSVEEIEAYIDER